MKDQVAQPDIIEDEKFYGMHRHFTNGSSILMWGGGIEKGLVYGKTADERPCSSIENPVVIDQVHQSIYHALGMHPETQYTIEGEAILYNSGRTWETDFGSFWATNAKKLKRQH